VVDTDLGRTSGAVGVLSLSSNLQPIQKNKKQGSVTVYAIMTVGSVLGLMYLYFLR
jgi:hypothetical protein